MPTQFQFIAFLIKHNALEQWNEAFFDPDNDMSKHLKEKYPPIVIDPWTLENFFAKIPPKEWINYAFFWKDTRAAVKTSPAWYRLDVKWRQEIKIKPVII